MFPDAEFSPSPSSAGSPVSTQARAELLGVPVDRVTMQEAVQEIMHRLAGERTHQICFVNAHCINQTYRHEDYLKVLHAADLVFADGIGVKLAGMALGVTIPDNVNGTDMFPELCRCLSGSGRRVFLLGSRPGTPERVERWISEHYPDVEVSGYRDGYFSSREEAEVLDQIANSNTDLLLVAFGSPEQDLWIHQHLYSLNVGVAIGVGGLFDFFSGRIPRAPSWMRRNGLEWAYRLRQEPRRLFHRYVIGNPHFLARVAVARVAGRRVSR